MSVLARKLHADMYIFYKRNNCTDMATSDSHKDILKRATDLFFRYGIKSVSIDDICREMGMSKKTFYQHYSTKDELVDGLLSESVERMDQHLSQCLGDKPFEDLIHHFVHYQQTIKNDVRRVPTLVYDLQKYYPAQFAVFQERTFECQQRHLSALLERGKQEGWVREDLDVRLAAIFMAKIHGDGVRDMDAYSARGIDMMQMGYVSLEILVRGILSPKGLQLLQDKEQIINVKI